MTIVSEGWTHLVAR